MFKVRILSADATLFEGEAQAAFLPGTLGEFEVMDHHADLMSTLGKGAVRVRTNGALKEINITSGIVRIKDSELTACVEL
jgi:F-type H+-transporting ATPase subunit epsilon